MKAKATGKKTHWLRTTILVLLVCGIAGTAIGTAQFLNHPSRTYAWATLQFSFDGAADGIAPNGQAFRIEEMAGEEVLEAALEAAGLAGSYTTDQVRDSLVMQGVYPEDIVKQVMSYESLLSFDTNRELTITNYSPTTFNVMLLNAFDKSVSQSTLKNLLDQIITSYRHWFAQHYALTMSNQEDIFVLDNYDYAQRLTVISGTMDKIIRYAQELYEKNPTFTWKGNRFNDIAVKLTNLSESEVSRLNANITMNALTKDVTRLLTQYQNAIRELNNQLARQQERLARLDALIEKYDKNEILYLSTTESLTKIDGNSSETYDELVDNRKNTADEITSLNTEIATYQLRITDLLGIETANEAASETGSERAETGTDEASETSETISIMTEEEISAAAAASEEASAQRITDLEKELETLLNRKAAIEAEFAEMLEAYNAQEINDGTVSVSAIRYQTPKVISGDFVKKVIKTAGPLCAIGFIVCMALIFISRRKEERGIHP